jgi:hypothetical protein
MRRWRMANWYGACSNVQLRDRYGCSSGLPPLSRSPPGSYRPELMEAEGRGSAGCGQPGIFPDGWPRLRLPAIDVMTSGGRDSCVGWIEHGRWRRGHAGRDCLSSASGHLPIILCRQMDDRSMGVSTARVPIK